MAKGIIFNLPAHGHMNPTLPLARYLVDRGEDIIYYNTEEYRSKIERTGVRFRPYKIEDFYYDFPYDGDMIRLASLLAEVSAEVIDGHIDEIERERPDYIIHDSLCPWGKFFARYLKVPAFNTNTTFVFNSLTLLSMPGLSLDFTVMMFTGVSHVYKHYKAAWYLKRKYGVGISGPINIFSNKEKLNIVFTSREFHPNGRLLGEKHYLLAGPSIYCRGEAVDFPIDYLKNSGKKIIYISLGTIFNGHAGFFRTCLDAFGDKDVAVVISLGNNIDKESLGQIPGSITVADFVPQLEILKVADLFISHGGMNSVNESLYYGVPLILFPQQTEQLTVARRVKKLGAGICPDMAGLTADVLWQLSSNMLNNVGYREKAEKIGLSLREAGGYQRAAEEILTRVSQEF